MSVEFRIEKVAAQEEEDFWLLGFADREIGTESYLMLQRSFEFSDDDVACGMDTYYLEINDQGQSMYGGLTQVTLSPSRAEFVFEEAAAEFFGIDNPLVLRFDSSPEEWRRIRETARQVLGDTLRVADAP